MPYSNELDYDYMGNPVARQNTIPSGRNWRMNAAVAKEAARKAAEEEEMYNWYLQNRGVMSPEGDYYGPELSAAPHLDYDPTVRQVGQPMRRREAYPQYDERFMDNLGDLVLGYDPREGAEDYEPEEFGTADKAMFGAMFAPGRVGRTAGALLGADIAYDIARGRRVPGAIDAMWLGGLGARGARNAYRAGKAFTNAYKNRRAYERMLKANALPRPRPNTKAWTGRRFEDVYVDPNMEFTPYEEVRF